MERFIVLCKLVGRAGLSNVLLHNLNLRGIVELVLIFSLL